MFGQLITLRVTGQVSALKLAMKHTCERLMPLIRLSCSEIFAVIVCKIIKYSGGILWIISIAIHIVEFIVVPAIL